MENETLGDRLVRARALRGLDQIELAERTGVKQTTLSKIERGRTLKSGDTPLFAHELQVEALWLATGRGPMERAATDTVNLDGTVDQEQDVTIYQFMDPRCAHGPNFGDEHARDMTPVAVPAEVFEQLGISERHFVGHITTDDAMRDALPVGARSAFDIGDTDVSAHNGAIYALHIGTGVMLRKVYATVSSTYRVVCANPDKEQYRDEVVERLKVIGRVRWRSVID